MKYLPAACLLAALFTLVLTAPAADKDEPAVKLIVLDKLNTPADEDDPFLASNGLTLYYSSNGAKGGDFDFMFAQRATPRTAWPAGKLLEGYLTTTVDDRSVYLTAENVFPQYLYFATKKDKAINNYDIYVAQRQKANVDFSAPTPVNNVCTEADEMHPWLSNQGKQLWFSRKTKEGWRVFVTNRPMAVGAAGFVGEPELVKDLPPNFHRVTLTPDGKTMYVQGPLEKERWGIFRSTAMGAGWSKPELVEELNSADSAFSTRSPALSRDGTLLYFASDRPGGKGGMDLYAVPTAQLGKKK